MFSLISTLIGGVTQFFKGRQEIKKAVIENKVRLAKDAQSFNHEWEMASLTNAGYKDDILFYAIVGMFVYSAIDPDGAAKVFKNWEAIPAWFREITMWMVASIIGVRKLGQYLPELMKGIRDVFK